MLFPSQILEVGDNGFPAPGRLIQDTPPSSQGPPPGLQSNELASRLRPGPSLTWYELKAVALLPEFLPCPGKHVSPTQPLGLVCSGAQVGDVDRFSPAPLCGPWSARKTCPNSEDPPPKPAPRMQVNWRTKTCNFPTPLGLFCKNQPQLTQ